MEEGGVMNGSCFASLGIIASVVSVIARFRILAIFIATFGSVVVAIARITSTSSSFVDSTSGIIVLSAFHTIFSTFLTSVDLFISLFPI